MTKYLEHGRLFAFGSRLEICAHERQIATETLKRIGNNSKCNFLIQKKIMKTE